MQGSVGDQSGVQMVSDLLTHTPYSWNPVRWNVSLVRSLYSGPTAHCILSTPISIVTGNDTIIWMRGNSGSYTAKSGFGILFDDKFQAQPGVDPFWKFLWSISLPKKQLLFMWKLFHQAIPTVDVLKSHHLMVTGLCRFGCKMEESIHHLFFSCDVTKTTWFGCFSIRISCCGLENSF